MALTVAQQVDFLWKKLIYGVTDTSNGGKQAYEESIGSYLFVQGSNVWAQNPPTPAPASTTSIVQVYPTTSAIQMTPDPTVAGNKAWFATTTYNNISTRTGDWIPPSIDPTYLVQIYKNDPTVPANLLNQGTSGYEYVIDYETGILQFVNTVPAGITSLYLVGYRYIGSKGLNALPANVRSIELKHSTGTISSGTATYTSFFSSAPEAGAIEVQINGVRLENAIWSVSGTNLIITVGGYGSPTGLPYPIENNDIISVFFGF